MKVRITGEREGGHGPTSMLLAQLGQARQKGRRQCGGRKKKQNNNNTSSSASSYTQKQGRRGEKGSGIIKKKRLFFLFSLTSSKSFESKSTKPRALSSENGPFSSARHRLRAASASSVSGGSKLSASHPESDDSSLPSNKIYSPVD